MLNMKIAAYRNLKEGEETRLGMSQIEETSDAGMEGVGRGRGCVWRWRRSATCCPHSSPSTI